MAGFAKEYIATKINRTLRERFGTQAPRVDDEFNDGETVTLQIDFVHPSP